MSRWMKKNYNKTTKRCPFCKARLEVKGMRHYQNLIEHVSDPNREPCSKPYYQCDCEDAKDGFWGSDGAIYGKMNSKKFKYFFKNWYHEYKDCLIGSQDRAYHKREYLREGFKYGKLIKKYWSIRYHIHKYFDNKKCSKRVDSECEIVNKEAISSMPKWTLEHDFDLEDEFISILSGKFARELDPKWKHYVIAVGRSTSPCRSYLIGDGKSVMVVKQYGLEFIK